MFEKLFLILLRKRRFHGILRLSFNGKDYSFGEVIPEQNPDGLIREASIRVHDREFFRRVILFGDTGIGEAYFLREFETDDLKRLLLWFVQNKDALPGFRERRIGDLFFEWAKILLKIGHFRNRNTIRGSKRNIKAHYDVSNAFYRLWLDPSMTYSSAVFEGTENLEAAQMNKYRKICENIGLEKHDHVLEIGSGWGGFAIYAAKRLGCRITTITISDEQYAYAKVKIEEEGLSDLIDIRLVDYREVEGRYDKIVSIEMMEAIGHAYVPIFIGKCGSLLRKGGKSCFQFITYPDEHFDAYLKNTGFIKKYIFPGGELLSLNRVKDALSKDGFTIDRIESIGLDYAKTLDIWGENLIAKEQEILKLGFSAEDIRMWLYYFAYCEVGFRSGYIDNLQLTAEKD